jgi:hypothetical protein
VMNLASQIVTISLQRTCSFSQPLTTTADIAGEVIMDEMLVLQLTLLLVCRGPARSPECLLNSGDDALWPTWKIFGFTLGYLGCNKEDREPGPESLTRRESEPTASPSCGAVVGMHCSHACKARYLRRAK